MTNMTVHLSEEAVAFVDAKVRSGDFHSNDEVILAALAALRDRTAAFNTEVQIGIDAAERGEVVEVADAHAWLVERRTAR